MSPIIENIKKRRTANDRSPSPRACPFFLIRAKIIRTKNSGKARRANLPKS
jgi:hypothetical protein